MDPGLLPAMIPPQDREALVAGGIYDNVQGEEKQRQKEPGCFLLFLKLIGVKILTLATTNDMRSTLRNSNYLIL